MVNKFFLYRHIRQDLDTPFYIGIGTKKQHFTSFKTEYRRAFEETNRTKHWDNIVNKTNYEIEILFESDDYNFIKEKEIEFITLYGRKDLNLGSLVNFTNGGEGNFGRKFTELQKNACSLRMLGQRRNPGKHIYQFNLQGNFIKKWVCIIDAAKTLNIHGESISRVAKGKQIQTGNYLWSYDLFLFNTKVLKESTKKIFQYNINGDFIKEWKNIENMYKELNICKSSVYKCLKDISKTSHGFIWKYEKKDICGIVYNKNYKKIYQIDIKSNKVINIFNSMHHLHECLFPNCKFLSTKNSIGKVLCNIRKTAHKYKWSYINQEGIDGQASNSPNLK